MKRLNLYLCRNLLATLALAIGVATFMMVVGSFAKIFGMLAQGVPIQPLLLYILLRLPKMLVYTIPIGLLIATTLMFSALSANNELTVLRASGVSILQITAPLLLMGLTASALCLLLQFEYAPKLAHRARVMMRREMARTPLAMIEARSYIELADGLLLYIGSKDGPNIRDVRIYRLDKEDRLLEDIVARTGEIVVDEGRQRLVLVLSEVKIVRFDPEAPQNPAKTQRIGGRKLEYPVELGDKFNRKYLLPKPGDMTLAQLFANAYLNTQIGQATTKLYLELHLRAALALAPFSFMLLGIPFGMRLNRKENSVGLIASLLVVMLYFAALSFFETMHAHPEWHPELLMWTPNVLCQLGGITGLWLKR